MWIKIIEDIQIILSVHEGKSVFVLLWLLSGQLIFQVQFLLFLLVTFKSGIDVYSAGYYCGDAFPQRKDLQVMHCSVETVEVFPIQFSDQRNESLVDGIFQHSWLYFWRFFDVVVDSLEDVEDEVELPLIDVVDGQNMTLLHGVCFFDVLHDIDLLRGESVLFSVHNHFETVFHFSQ